MIPPLIAAAAAAEPVSVKEVEPRFDAITALHRRGGGALDSDRAVAWLKFGDALAARGHAPAAIAAQVSP